jgi:hypothetical protein
VAVRRTAADPLELIEAYRRTAVLAAAVRTGVADALAADVRSPEALAQACGCHARGVTALLGAMSALGLVNRDGEHFRLNDQGAVLARSHPETVALIVEKAGSRGHCSPRLPQNPGVTLSRHRALLTGPSRRRDPLPVGEQAGLSLE